jgi:gliding motility-associated-like protein
MPTAFAIRDLLAPGRCARACMLTAVLSYQTLTNLCLSQEKPLQPGMPPCGTDEVLAVLRRDDSWRRTEDALNARIRERAAVQSHGKAPLSSAGKEALATEQSSSAIQTVSVVFHIVNSNPDAVTDAMVAAVLGQVNDAFAHANAFDVDPKGADTRIRFCLARKDPNGGVTNGITRTKSYLGANDMELEPFGPSALVEWDPTRYANIWIVESITGEIRPSEYVCGNWSRMGVGGYAAAGRGVVGGGLSVSMLVHELGHYLSLAHTFQGLDCRNRDCTVDGDMVCDTPPDRKMSPSPCDDPDNSCNSDLQSGPFTVDQPDNISNFMDYGSPCPTVFTPGQGERMRAFIDVFNGGSLATGIACSEPCASGVLARFNTYANSHPKTGESVTFTNTSSGAASYRWEIAGAVVGTMADLVHPFPLPGTYMVRLVAYGSDPSCISTYEQKVVVNCGVDARFVPDKRVIAASKGVLSDPVTFRNKSQGATDHRWLIRPFPSGSQQVAGTTPDLTWEFDDPGFYEIVLEASSGSCTDLSTPFIMEVRNPKPDPVVTQVSADCYMNESLRVQFTLYNWGYDTVAARLPVAFYDRQPGTPGAVRLASDMLTPTAIRGRCYSQTFTHIVKASQPDQNQLFIWLDPDNILPELAETNNIGFITGIDYKVTAAPFDTLAFVNTNVNLRARVTPARPLTYSWVPSDDITCANCPNTVLRLKDTTRLKVFASNPYGCVDSAEVLVNVHPPELTTRSGEVYCFGDDSLKVVTRLCLTNGYDRLKRDLTLAYFDGDSTHSGARLLGTTVVPSGTVFNGGCLEVNDYSRMTGTGKLFAYANRGRHVFETSYADNATSMDYQPFRIRLPSDKLTVSSGVPVRLSILHSGERYQSLLWTPSQFLSCSDCPNPELKTYSNLDLKVVGESRYRCRDSALLDVKSVYQNRIAIPNVFTPDGDGLNDHFFIVAGSEVSSVGRMTVLNRWGEKVFDRMNIPANDLEAGWDGRHKGQPAPAGTYVYIISVRYQGGQTETFRGNITLIR